MKSVAALVILTVCMVAIQTVTSAPSQNELSLRVAEPNVSN